MWVDSKLAVSNLVEVICIDIHYSYYARDQFKNVGYHVIQNKIDASINVTEESLLDWNLFSQESQLNDICKCMYQMVANTL